MMELRDWPLSTVTLHTRSNGLKDHKITNMSGLPTRARATVLFHLVVHKNFLRMMTLQKKQKIRCVRTCKDDAAGYAAAVKRYAAQRCRCKCDVGVFLRFMLGRHTDGRRTRLLGLLPQTGTFRHASSFYGSRLILKDSKNWRPLDCADSVTLHT